MKLAIPIVTVILVIVRLNFLSFNQNNSMLIGTWNAVETTSMFDTLILKKVSKDSLFATDFPATFLAIDIQENGDLERIVFLPSQLDNGTVTRTKNGKWNLDEEKNISFSISILGSAKNYKIIKLEKQNLILVRNTKNASS